MTRMQVVIGPVQMMQMDIPMRMRVRPMEMVQAAIDMGIANEQLSPVHACIPPASSTGPDAQSYNNCCTSTIVDVEAMVTRALCPLGGCEGD